MFERAPKGSLCAGQPALLDACDKGLKWLALGWQVGIAWPELPHLIQCALNCHARQQQGEVEVLLEVGRLQKSALDRGCSPDWAAIKDTCAAQDPPCAPYMQSLIAYVRRQAPELMQDLSLFAK